MPEFAKKGGLQLFTGGTEGEKLNDQPNRKNELNLKRKLFRKLCEQA